MGRNKFSQQEIDQIAKLLHKKDTVNRARQKEIRHKLRVDYGFNISDYNEQGRAFGEADLQAAINRGAITLVDEATAAAMRERMARQHEADEARWAAESAKTTDTWQQAMKEWEAWEQGEKQQ